MNEKIWSAIAWFLIGYGSATAIVGLALNVIQFVIIGAGFGCFGAVAALKSRGWPGP